MFLLALLGLPATGGFVGKFFAFQSALDNHMVWLVIIAAINSVIGAYYYLRIVIAMYFWEPSKEYTPSKVAPALVFALSLAALGTLYLGILPGRVLDYAHSRRAVFRSCANRDSHTAFLCHTTRRERPHGSASCHRLPRLARYKKETARKLAATEPPGRVNLTRRVGLVADLHEHNRKRKQHQRLDEHQT